MDEEEIFNEQMKGSRLQNQLLQDQREQLMEEKERSMIHDQLDLSEELERIEHLLRGHVIRYDEENNPKWVESDDNEMVLLSEYGIHLVLNTITWYINKNTLLSNYDEDTILSKMEDFATDLADTIFMEYEKIFQYPTFEDCKKIFNERIDNKVKIRQFANEIIKENESEEDIRRKIKEELEGRIEIEIDKIKEQIIKNKLKRFVILIRTIQDSVHSTYLRAYKGMERKTLREHIHTTETLTPIQNKGGGGFSPLNWFKGSSK